MGRDRGEMDGMDGWMEEMIPEKRKMRKANLGREAV
jgi:hypothetical protein